MYGNFWKLQNCPKNPLKLETTRIITHRDWDIKILEPIIEVSSSKEPKKVKKYLFVSINVSENMQM